MFCLLPAQNDFYDIVGRHFDCVANNMSRWDVCFYSWALLLYVDNRIYFLFNWYTIGLAVSNKLKVQWTFNHKPTRRKILFIYNYFCCDFFESARAQEMNSNNIVHFFAFINSIKAFSGQYFMRFFYVCALLKWIYVFEKFIANTFRLNNTPHSKPYNHGDLIWNEFFPFYSTRRSFFMPHVNWFVSCYYIRQSNNLPFYFIIYSNDTGLQ